MIDFITEPFQYSFLKRALISCVCLALSSAPVGVLHILRRMSLMGDALSHAVLPGAAIGYMIAGLSLPVLGMGGFIAGLLVALLSGIVSLYRPQRRCKFCWIFFDRACFRRSSHFDQTQLH